MGCCISHKNSAGLPRYGTNRGRNGDPSPARSALKPPRRASPDPAPAPEPLAPPDCPGKTPASSATKQADAVADTAGSTGGGGDAGAGWAGSGGSTGPPEDGEGQVETGQFLLSALGAPGVGTARAPRHVSPGALDVEAYFAAGFVLGQARVPLRALSPGPGATPASSIMEGSITDPLTQRLRDRQAANRRHEQERLARGTLDACQEPESEPAARDRKFAALDADLSAAIRDNDAPAWTAAAAHAMPGLPTTAAVAGDEGEGEGCSGSRGGPD